MMNLTLSQRFAVAPCILSLLSSEWRASQKPTEFINQGLEPTTVFFFLPLKCCPLDQNHCTYVRACNSTLINSISEFKSLALGVLTLVNQYSIKNVTYLQR